MPPRTGWQQQTQEGLVGLCKSVTSNMPSLSFLSDIIRHGMKEIKAGLEAWEGYRYCSFLMSSSGLMKVL